MMIANAAMPYCLHGFQNAREQASGQGFSGELNVQNAVDTANELNWHGDEEEEEDFAWWEEVEQEILIELSRLEVPTSELTSIEACPSPEHAEPDLVRASGGPSGVHKDKEQIITRANPEEEEEEEEEEDTQLIRRSRRSSRTSPAPSVIPSWPCRFLFCLHCLAAL